jgi:hypothetical protein
MMMIEEVKSLDIRPFRESGEADIIALWGDLFGYPASHNDPATVIPSKLTDRRDLFSVARPRVARSARRTSRPHRWRSWTWTGS